MKHLMEQMKVCTSRMALAALDIFPGNQYYFERINPRFPMCIDMGYRRDTEDEEELTEPCSWEPSACSNGSLLVLGASGSGKTETLKKVGRAVIHHPIPLLIIDFHGDIVFPGQTSFLLSSGFDSCIGVNPLELPSLNHRLIGLRDQWLGVTAMLKRACPHLSQNQLAIITFAIGQAFRNAGIEEAFPWTWSNQAPRLVDVLDVLRKWGEDGFDCFSAASIRGCYNAVTSVFGHPVFNRFVGLDLNRLQNACTRIDLSHVDESIRFLVAETLLRLVFAKLRGLGPIPVNPASDKERYRLMILIDEAKILTCGKGDPDSRDRILNVLITEGRKFGIGLILASQMVDHFGQDVLSNVASLLVMKPMDAREAKRNAATVQVPYEDLLALRGRGEGYFKTGGNPRAVKLQVTMG